MLVRLAPLLKLVAAVVSVLVMFDVLVFRTGAYWRVVEPESTAGTTLGALHAARELRDPQRKNVLVLGNSQIGEGFSALVADAASGRPDLHFVNAAVPGTTPRVWDYLLRAVDPQADRFAAVVFMTAYDTFGIEADPADYPYDISYLAPLIGLADLPALPGSFHDAEGRARAWRAVLLPLQAMREDVLALLAHPWQRYKKTSRYYPGWLASVVQYRGRAGRLPELALDPATGQPGSWDEVPAELRDELQEYLAALHRAGYGSERIRAVWDDYVQRWIGSIAQRYRAQGVPVVLFVAPRGPCHGQRSPVPVPAGALAGLRAAGLVQTLPGDAFTDLEQPRFFFDTRHMNQAGREAFSSALALRVAALVP